MYHFDTGIMNNFERIILNSLNYNYEYSMTQLQHKTECWNRNTLVKAVDSLESQGLLTTRKEGRERLVKIPIQEEETKKFVNDYGISLKNYTKLLKENLKLLKKNMPLVPIVEYPNSMMKRIKIREPVLELDEKSQVWTDQGKTQEGHAYTWKTRSKPLGYFNNILNILRAIYEETSAISFSEFLDDESNTKKIQKEAKNLINDTLDKLAEILNKHPESKAYSTFYVRNTLHGFIHQIILDKRRKESMS